MGAIRDHRILANEVLLGVPVLAQLIITSSLPTYLSSRFLDRDRDC
jgi:hypothetical protein